MALITLGSINTLWTNVSSWVKGTDAVSSPKVTVSAALPAGTNNLGSANVATAAKGTTVAGSPTSASVDANTQALHVGVALALPVGSNTIGNVGLVAGASTIGSVGVNAGTNLMGKVGIDQTTPGTTNGVQVVAALPAGANALGTVVVTALPAIPSGANAIGTVGVTTLPTLPAGTNLVGKFGIDQTTPGTTNGIQVVAALPAGANTIGTVNAQSLAGTVLNTVSAAITVTTTSADLTAGAYRELAIDVNISAITGTTPSYTLGVNRKGVDGVYYPIYTGTAQTAVGKVSISLGKGASTNTAFGNTIQLVETVAGTTPSVTRSVSIIGK